MRSIGCLSDYFAAQRATRGEVQSPLTYMMCFRSTADPESVAHSLDLNHANYCWKTMKKVAVEREGRWLKTVGWRIERVRSRPVENRTDSQSRKCGKAGQELRSRKQANEGIDRGGKRGRGKDRGFSAEPKDARENVWKRRHVGWSDKFL
jgi:hypothetical protein